MANRSVRTEHYRSKAEECRIIAESTTDLEAKRFLIGVSADYLMLANLIERLALSDPIPASE